MSTDAATRARSFLGRQTDASIAGFSLQMQAIAITFMALQGAGVAQSESSRLKLGD
jgi:hypothetical protein